MKKTIRITALLLALVLAFPCAALAGENEDIVSCSWVTIKNSAGFSHDEIDGVKAYPYNQCNDLVIRYYEEVYGVDMWVGIDPPVAFPSDDPFAWMFGVPSEYDFYIISGNPRRGDVVYWSPEKRNKDYAHSALVKSYENGVITLIEQNWNSGGKAAFERKVAYPSSDYDVYRLPDSVLNPESPAPAAASSAIPVKVSTQSVVLDSRQVFPTAYNIGGYNYFMLRDVASLLSGTDATFSVDYDNETRAITLTTGEIYDRSSGIANRSPASTGTPSTSQVYIDGEAIEFTAYLINGNNYFKLRDLAAALDFGVTYDGETGTVVIDSTTGYTPE